MHVVFLVYDVIYSTKHTKKNASSNIHPLLMAVDGSEHGKYEKIEQRFRVFVEADTCVCTLCRPYTRAI